MDWNKRKIKNILFVPDFGLNELRKAAEEDIGVFAEARDLKYSICLKQIGLIS